MAIYLSRKKGGTVATPITPSNSSPAQMTANVAVNPTVNGYAIESYDSVTPSSTPTSISSGDIVKIGGSGVIVDSIPTPINLFPSNTNPATITNGNLYEATSDGKAVTSVTDLTPSNTTPVYLYANSVYKAVTNGYAISSYSSKTPSDSSPASVSSGAIIKASASGYLYATQQPKVKTGTFTTSTSGTTTVNCGFKPKYLAIEIDGTSSSATHMLWIYNEDTSSSSAYYASASVYPSTRSLPSTANNTLASIDSTGFTFNLTSSRARTARYFAIG